MRALFLLLLLANVAFFVWAHLTPPSGADDAPLVRQVDPHKLKVVPPNKLSPA